MALPPLSIMDDRTPGLHRPVVHRFRAKPSQLSQFDRAMGGRSRPPDAAASGNRVATEVERKHRIEDGVRTVDPTIEDGLLQGGPWRWPTLP
jgi:hypothetical protein